MSDPEVTPHAAFEVVNVIAEPTAQHNLSLVESGSIIVSTNVGGCAFSIPPGLPVGWNVSIISLGGDSGLQPASGITVNGVLNMVTTSKQGYTGASLLVIENNKLAISGAVGP